MITMEKEVKYKIVELLKSHNKEMCQLAVVMFNGLTKDYQDYFDVRTLYQPNGILIGDADVKMALNQMYNNIDMTTVKNPLKKHENNFRMLTLSSKQKRKKHKENAKKRVKLPTS